MVSHDLDLPHKSHKMSNVSANAKTVVSVTTGANVTLNGTTLETTTPSSRFQFNSSLSTVTAESTANSKAPSANSTAPKANSTAPKANSTAPKANSTAPKANSTATTVTSIPLVNDTSPTPETSGPGKNTTAILLSTTTERTNASSSTIHVHDRLTTDVSQFGNTSHSPRTTSNLVGGTIATKHFPHATWHYIILGGGGLVGLVVLILFVIFIRRKLCCRAQHRQMRKRSHSEIRKQQRQKHNGTRAYEDLVEKDFNKNGGTKQTVVDTDLAGSSDEVVKGNKKDSGHHGHLRTSRCGIFRISWKGAADKPSAQAETYKKRDDHWI